MKKNPRAKVGVLAGIAIVFGGILVAVQGQSADATAGAAGVTAANPAVPVAAAPRAASTKAVPASSAKQTTTVHTRTRSS
jgi:hypothetical protein